jgi:nucleoid-associated protein YgaU
MAPTYVTQSGDNLTTIAEQFNGDGTLWRKVYEANRKVIGSDPDRLGVGLDLTIPLLG